MTYDCFTFFNEIDLLEMRLNILDPYVDKFVICESRLTFSGKEKPLYYKENAERFSKWADKIIWVEYVSSIDSSNAFERAYWQKEFLKIALSDCKDDDIIYYGDVDEMWKPQDIKDGKVYSLEQLNYCYYLNNRSSERWVGTIVGKWGTVKTEDLAHWRANHTNEITNAGWHFTNMGGLEQIKKKLEAYDHQEMNTLETQTLLEDRMNEGEDYVGRKVDWEGKPFSFYLDEVDLPQYLLDNKNKYANYFK